MARRSNIRRRGKSHVAYLRLNGRQVQRSFPSSEQAEYWLAAMMRKRSDGDVDEFDRNVAQRRKTTFAEFASKWLSFVRGRVKRRTLEAYSGSLRCHLIPALGEYKLGAITSELIDQFVADWLAGGSGYQERLELAREREEVRWQREQQAAREAEIRAAAAEGRHPRFVDVPRRSVRLGNSPGTISNALTAIHALLADAVRWGYIRANPADGVRRPPNNHGADDMHVLTREQVEALVEAARPEARVAILVAVSTGVRRGELLALKWADVDTANRRLWVRRSVNRHGEFDTPKSRRSQRAIALAPTVVQELREHRLRSSFSADGDLVFPNRDGGPIDGGNFVRREFKPALKRAGVPVVRFHDLRHTFASLLIARGLPPKLISEQLGHASIIITMDRYGHLFDQSYADASEGIEAALFGSPAADAASISPASASAGPPPGAAQPQPASQSGSVLRLPAAGGGTG